MSGSWTVINRLCPICEESSGVRVRTDDYGRWKTGVLIQDAFPYLSVAQREKVKTGYCTTCWDDMWGDDNDDDDEGGVW